MSESEDRISLTPTSSTGAYPLVAGWLEFTAGNAEFGNKVLMNGRYIVYAKNTDSVNQTVAIVTVADPHGRFDDKDIVIEPGAIARICGIANNGFIQSDGCFYIDVSDASVELSVWRLDR